MNRSRYGASSRVGQLQRRLERKVGLPFESVLPLERVQSALERSAEGFLERLFSPAVTLWAFLSQVLDRDKTCQNALSRIKAFLALRAESCSPSTSAYSQARGRMPPELPEQLRGEVAEELERQVLAEHQWCGRRVKVADGSSSSMPDTAENQAAFPQPSSQKKGCGFPVVQFVVLFSLATGALLGLSPGSLGDSEGALFRQLWDLLRPGEVLLGDSRYCSYAEIALLHARGVDVVARLSAARQLDWQRAERLGEGDALFVWTRPKKPPKWLTPEQLLALPPQMRMRVVRFEVPQKGFRPSQIVLCTTLLDPRLYPKEELARLYRLRWDAELNLRHLKSTLGMEHLRCKSPQMVLKELCVFALAYNLLRSLMFEAACSSGRDPRRLSLKQSVQLVDSYAPLLAVLPASQLPFLRSMLLHDLAEALIPERPNRVEPRYQKRRPKNFPFLTRPRREPRQPVDV